MWVRGGLQDSRVPVVSRHNRAILVQISLLWSIQVRNQNQSIGPKRRMTHSYVFHDSFILTTRLIPVFGIWLYSEWSGASLFFDQDIHSVSCHLLVEWMCSTNHGSHVNMQDETWHTHECVGMTNILFRHLRNSRHESNPNGSHGTHLNVWEFFVSSSDSSGWL